ncbi:AidA/PixA family protein [Pseudoalteromonas sp. R3]|uniref:AidA/PixA family protein n=1 Tax=Pseudoalteromonas sp. R3 TaxID=1709477 RepID=UPI0006B51DAC|nr:AidA/PixA family protein [Pseudoalteromonas sp. R3]AZZ98021.1 hypothetical protein ELR70_13390 [Pseudoalteromonas sp. R3]
MSQINILVAVDAEKLADKVADGTLSAGSAEHPTPLGAWSQSDVFISMIAQHGVAVNNQGQSELTIQAESGDFLQWAMTTFGNNTDHTASIYNGSFNPSNGIEAFGSEIQQENNYLVPSDDSAPTTFTKVVNQFSVYQAKITKVKQSIQYTLSFALVNNQSGSVVGYFTWDPFINVA